MPEDNIVKNSMIKEIVLLRKRPAYTWVTIWPFIILYIVSVTLYLNPELVWDRVTYLVHQTYIDFFHAICLPVVVFLHGFLSLFTIWSVKFRSLILFTKVSISHLEQASHILVVTHLHKGESEIVELHHTGDDGMPPYFLFQQRKWKLDEDENIFVKPRFPTKHPFSYYIKWEGLNTESAREEQIDQYGRNLMEVVIPEFQDLFVDHALAPFFVFQMFCVLLWCLDEYWYYSLFTGVMMAAMECMTIYQRIRNMKTLRDMAEVPVKDVTVWRGGKEVCIRTTELLPMDILVVPNNSPCPVDALLIKGTAVVNEASLTGESTPQLKEAPDESETTLSVKKHARHMIFSGTQILLSSQTGEKTKKRKNALAVVLKTGFETKQGKLLRTILHSQGRVSENSGEAFGFIGILVVFALAASGYLLKRGLADPNRSRWNLFLSCVQIITSVVPPELPMELSMAVNSTLMALIKLKVFCTEPFRIPYAGMIDTCCFDKTGTLTTDEMLFGGIDMIDGKGILNKIKTIPKYSELVLASCHSLVYLDENVLAGDEMEKAATGALGYRMDEEDNVIHDPHHNKKEEDKKEDGLVADPKKNCKIHLRFPFLASLRRMSCVVSNNEGKFVVVKGSAESIVTLCSPSTIPKDCIEVAEKTAAQGYRVIALAYRRFSADEAPTKEAMAQLKREDVEKDLIFAGLALYVCPLKKDAKETIENLTGGSHRCVIITGDSVQTAISVGKDVSMLMTKRQLIATMSPNGGREVVWVDALTNKEVCRDKATAIKNTFERTRKKKEPREGEWDLCVNAENLSTDQLNIIIEDYNEQVTIWARCAPTQKEAIVTDLKKKGHIVMMAGDGTNDVGALKQAHAGIAVLNSSSVAQENKDVPLGPQPHNEPDVPADLLIPPGFTFTVVPPQPAQDAGFKALMGHKMAETKRKQEIMQITAWNKKLKEAEKMKKDAKSIDAPKSSSTNVGSSDFLMESMFNADDENFSGPPMIKLGDASIAAPFTCRSKALTSVCDIVRLGRTTLVTTHMMYKIIALNCLVSAYSMSVLRCEGVKMGEKQMILSGVILSVCFMFMSRSKPLPKLCPQRPVTRLFHPYMISTVFLQFALHLYCMVQTAMMVTEADKEGVEEARLNFEDEKFKPSLLNSTMFLMTTLISGVTFAVNYRGEPFMQSIWRNRPMIVALIILALVIFSFASEGDPEVNEMFEIVVFPSQEFRERFVRLLMADAIGCFIIEKLSLMFFTDY